MKKFMKAIAFATVMCMLLSVAAFATEPELEISETGTISVEITYADAVENQQIAFVAANSDVTEATALATGNILDVQQVAFVGGVARVTLNVGEAEAASVFYGYEGVGTKAGLKSAGVVEVDTELRIVLDSAIEVIPDAAADPRYVGDDAIAESDKGALVYATVSFVNYDNEVVTNIGWQFVNADGAEKRIDYPVSGLEILNGDVQVGVAFTNGNGTTRAPFVTESTNVSLWFKFADKLLQAVAE